MGVPGGHTARIVIAHDFMQTYGGAERVTEAFARAFPDAPVYALLGDPAVAERMGISERFHSILAPRRGMLEHYRLATPAFPVLAAARRLPEADVLLTSSYAFAHHLRTADDAPQVCYCHSPLRFAWTMTDAYADHWAHGGATRRGFTAMAFAMRAVDKAASRRVTRYLTQSDYTGDQISRFYGRRSHIVGAPIDCTRFRPSGRPPGEGFLFVGRIIEPYKRLTMTIEAFRRLGLPLVVAGDGPSLAGLRADAPPNVTFTGHLEDEALVRLMQEARALVFPSRDDFGLLPLEANACGRPVIAYGAGGALRTVEQGLSGVLFPEQTADSLVEALKAFRDDDFDPVLVRNHALKWDEAPFRARIVEHVQQTAAGRPG